MAIQQRTLEELQEPQMRRESRIRFSYANCFKAVKALLSESERQGFYNVARRICPLKPWAKFLSPLRAVARAAALDGRPIVVEQTRTLIHEVFANCEASVMALLPEPALPVSITEAIRAEGQAECAADPMEQEAFRDPSLHNIESALPSLRVHKNKLDSVVSAFERTVFSTKPQTRLT